MTSINEAEARVTRARETLSRAQHAAAVNPTAEAKAAVGSARADFEAACEARTKALRGVAA